VGGPGASHPELLLVDVAEVHPHPALWLWTACYAGYLFIFWLPTSSTVRILLPLFPLSLLVAAYLPKSRVYRLLLVLIGLLGSALWMRLLWGGPDVIGPFWLLP
jgi:integral membrane protein (fragment)